MTVTMTNVYTSDEVARHNKENDLWMVIHGGVYDLTKFLKEHPGGEEVLINLAGQDGTVCFDDIGHSMEAVLLRDTFKIGEILSGDNGTAASSFASSHAKNEPTVDDDNWEYQEVKEEKNAVLPVILAIGVLIYGILFYLWL